MNKLAILLFVVLAVFFLYYPQLNEGVDSNCQALEEKFSHEEAPLLAIFTGLSGGDFARHIVKSKHPKIPPALSCSFYYYNTKVLINNPKEKNVYPSKLDRQVIVKDQGPENGMLNNQKTCSVTNTKYGEIVIKKRDLGASEIYLWPKLLYISGDDSAPGCVEILHTYNYDKSLVLLLTENVGGAAGPFDQFFITIFDNKEITVSNRFFSYAEDLNRVCSVNITY